jgi:hypothetical protein
LKLQCEMLAGEQELCALSLVRHVWPVLPPDTAIAAVGAVIERITGSATARPAAPTVIRRSAVRRLIPVR